MNHIPSKLHQHMKSPLTTLATCWKLTLKNNKKIGFTDGDKDIDIDGIKYLAKSVFIPSEIQKNRELYSNMKTSHKE
ncbi:baseplate hub domain-containing protein [Rickettsia endosymbiont of Cardiosporidium cionae]|uniref:baseplate hub domain-containing protein n=1 Tax=Rickettsia endosymbiont of Cardiosporidium cionae TaxID=2777155 RepID=UPI0018937C03|nr:DUF2163 domain-containing protein [Rickettsia endosymbiont of Cardiosporidium cionae]KAF8818012.1 hypothetical protein IHI24_000927 [Rickettsia endosymbiont of Cardiosporidium cionae]